MLNGNRVISYEMSRQNNSFVSPYISNAYLKPLHEMDVVANMIVDNDLDFGHVFGKQLISLGDGKTCKYCRRYNPAGLCHCYNCQGILSESQLITPRRFPFSARSFESGFSPHNMPTAQVSFVSCGVVTTEDIEFFQQSNNYITSLPYTVTVDFDYFICEWCGMASDGMECHGCGGGKIPLSEAVNIQRACLYCGKDEAFDGIMCQSCGARLIGQTLRSVIA
jgi:hypothetical protein